MAKNTQTQFTCRLEGNKAGLDLLRDLFLSRDDPVVHLLAQMTGKEVVSRRIVDMDLPPRTGVF